MTQALITSDHSRARRFLDELLAVIGQAMARYQKVIIGVQWLVVVFYVFLVAVPAFLPLPSEDTHTWNNLTRVAQFVFWGIWWPFVMLSMMLMGRTWCGVFCPEGAVSEWVSKRGLQRTIPRWIRWGGWPFVSFACTTIVGQLTSVYQYPKPALLILGGSTLAAIAIGFLYGRGVRVWCRFLCPANGVFTLLSRLAPVHFGVDNQKWREANHNTASVDCPPILDVHHKAGTGHCHSCGRCGGHRGAVQLQWRSSADEITTMKLGRFERVEVFTLLYGLLGIAVAAFQWSSSPWFLRLKQTLAEAAVNHNVLWLLNDNAPWFVLTHYPEANDVFTWLDGLAILLYIALVTAINGGWALLFTWLASRLVTGDAKNTWRLAYGLTPLGGISVFLGLSMLTLSQLATEHLHVPQLGIIRGVVLSVAVVWSLWLTRKICARWTLKTPRQIAVHIFMLLAMLPVLALWYFQFYVW